MKGNGPLMTNWLLSSRVTLTFVIGLPSAMRVSTSAEILVSTVP